MLLLKDTFDVDIKQKEKQTPVQLLSHLWSQKSVLCLMIWGEKTVYKCPARVSMMTTSYFVQHNEISHRLWRVGSSSTAMLVTEKAEHLVFCTLLQINEIYTLNVFLTQPNTNRWNVSWHLRTLWNVCRNYWGMINLSWSNLVKITQCRLLMHSKNVDLKIKLS